MCSVGGTREKFAVDVEGIEASSQEVLLCVAGTQRAICDFRPKLMHEYLNGWAP